MDTSVDELEFYILLIWLLVNLNNILFHFNIQVLTFDVALFISLVHKHKHI